MRVETTADGMWVVIEGVDSYDAATGEVTSYGRAGVQAWFLDDDYDGTVFRVAQAFFPVNDAWEGCRRRTRVSGSWTATDDVTQIDEEYEDAGFRIRTTGTNTRLDARVVVVVDGQTVPLEMHHAFAYDLTVTRLPV